MSTHLVIHFSGTQFADQSLLDCDETAEGPPGGGSTAVITDTGRAPTHRGHVCRGEISASSISCEVIAEVYRAVLAPAPPISDPHCSAVKTLVAFGLQGAPAYKLQNYKKRHFSL